MNKCTDESKFEMHVSNRSVYVRTETGGRMIPQCFKPTVIDAGGKIRVWGCYASSGVGHLHRLDYTLNKAKHHSHQSIL